MQENKIRIALINPGFTFESKNFYLTEPLGLLYLSGYLKDKLKEKIEINLIDAISEKGIRKEKGYYQFGLTNSEIVERLKNNVPDYVGITNLFSLRKKEMFDLAGSIKKFNPGIKIIVGGIYPTIFPETTLSSKDIDYLFIGESENTLCDFFELKFNDGDITQINGFGYKENDQIFINQKTEFIEDLDSIPFPDRESINFKFYLEHKMKLYGLGMKPKASIITSRSCPNRCNFCSMYLSHGPKWRSRSAENVSGEISYLKKKYDIQELMVMDDNFSFSKDRVIKICQYLIDNKINIKWNTPNGLSAKTLDKETLQIMKKSGCVRISIAIESGDTFLRNKIIGKGISDRKLETVVNAANEIDLSIFAYYILGMPGETEESFNKTLEQIRKLKLNGVATSFATPLPGTKLFKECKEKGYIQDSFATEQKFNMPLITTEDFSIDDVVRREKRFYFTFLKSHFFQIIIDAVRGKNDLLNLFFLKRIIYDKLLKFF